MTVKELIKGEIEKLPEEILTEVLDFIKFMESKREEELLVKSAMKLSESSLEKIWDNKEDSVYDAL